MLSTSRSVASPLLRRLHGESVPQHRDVLRMSVSSDGFVAGPPCVDFSLLGDGAGMTGIHGSLMGHTLSIIKELSHRGDRPLRWIVLENVAALGYDRKCGNALNAIRAWWSEHMPHWTNLVVWKVDSLDCGLAQRRNRLFLVAFERAFANMVGGLPGAPPLLAKRPLVDFLVDDQQRYSGHDRPLTTKQQGYLDSYMRLFEARAAPEPLVVAIADVSRNPMERKASACRRSLYVSPSALLKCLVFGVASFR